MQNINLKKLQERECMHARITQNNDYITQIHTGPVNPFYHNTDVRHVLVVVRFNTSLLNGKDLPVIYTYICGGVENIQIVSE